MAGQRINDHSAWMGSRGKDSVLPDGPHKTKAMSSAEGDGAVSKYEDTSEAVKAQQMAGVKKMKGYAHKAGTRN